VFVVRRTRSNGGFTRIRKPKQTFNLSLMSSNIDLEALLGEESGMALGAEPLLGSSPRTDSLEPSGRSTTSQKITLVAHSSSSSSPSARQNGTSHQHEQQQQQQQQQRQRPGSIVISIPPLSHHDIDGSGDAGSAGTPSSSRSASSSRTCRRACCRS
jgi:hypothetical protein